MVDNSLLNGEVSMISTKLYPRLHLYHFLKFWKKYTTLALFLNGRFTQKRTETKLTKQNKAKALVWNFFPQPAVGDIQLLFNISPLIILWPSASHDRVSTKEPFLAALVLCGLQSIISGEILIKSWMSPTAGWGKKSQTSVLTLFDLVYFVSVLFWVRRLFRKCAKVVYFFQNFKKWYK